MAYVKIDHTVDDGDDDTVTVLAYCSNCGHQLPCDARDCFPAVCPSCHEPFDHDEWLEAPQAAQPA